MLGVVEKTTGRNRMTLDRFQKQLLNVKGTSVEGA